MRFKRVSAVGLMACLALVGSDLRAATIRVENLDDSGPGSLRQAISDAASGDTVVIDVTGTITLTSGTIRIVGKNLRLRGPGGRWLVLSGGEQYPVFSLFNSRTTLTDLTIANGSAQPVAGIASLGINVGGGIFASQGALAIERCTVRNNLAPNLGVGTERPLRGFGGGIGAVNVELTVVDSAILHNVAEGAGGGIYVVSVSVLNPNAPGPPFSMVSTTMSGNRALEAGGGLLMEAETTFRNSTIVDNEAPAGGGFALATLNGSHSTSIFSSILAGNRGGSCALPPTVNAFSVTDDPTCGFDTVEHSLNVDDVRTGNLEDNGGPTLTHALLPGSPAIDAGDSAGCRGPAGVPLSADQRGFTRAIDGGSGMALCDAGSYEAGATASCRADCDGDGGSSSASDLRILVTSLLNGTTAASCAIADMDHDGLLTVTDLINAVSCARRPAS